MKQTGSTIHTIEAKTKITIILGILIYFFFAVFHNSVYEIFNPGNFLSFHTIFELISMAFSLSIFLQSWAVFPNTLSRTRLLLGTSFFTISCFELMHTLTYEGMPFFFGDSSAHRATWFWLFARIIESFTFLYLCFGKDVKVKSTSRKYVGLLAILFVIASSCIILFWNHLLPNVINQNQGLTSMKRLIEAFICSLYLIALFSFYRKAKRTQDENDYFFSIALTFIFLSEVTFAIYHHIYDLDNLIGHVYRVIGNVFILRSLYVATIQKPYDEQKQTAKALKKSKNDLQMVTSSIGEGIFVLDEKGFVTFLNPEGERLLGFSEKEVLHRSAIHIFQCKHGDDQAYAQIDDEPELVDHFKTTEHERTAQTCYFKRKDSSYIPVSYISTPIVEKGTFKGRVIAFRDISDVLAKEEQIHHMAYFDELTDLPNIRFFKEAFEKQILYARAKNKPFALFYIDIDRFKMINDSLGHAFGDQVIRKVGKRIDEMLTIPSTIARNAGDGFAILFPTIATKTQAKQIAEQILAAFKDPFVIHDYELRVLVSIGIAFYPFDGEDFDHLLKHTDIALNLLKGEGGNHYKFFNQTMNETVTNKLLIETDLRKAIENEEFLVYYQPKVPIKTREVIGFEALIRWMHPVRGMVSPGDFIPIAEESGLIIEIGQWVIETVCKQIKAWENNHLNPKPVAINLSIRQFYQIDFIHHINMIIEKTNVHPSLIEFEITESMSTNIEYTVQLLNQLKALGFKISIDDFGTGYSSLQYLKDLPIDTLKIDQSFVRNMENEAKHKTLIKTIISMAKSMSLHVIAEGVETKEQLQFLQSLSCDTAQGYYFSKPLPQKELELFLKSYQHNVI